MSRSATRTKALWGVFALACAGLIYAHWMAPLAGGRIGKQGKNLPNLVLITVDTLRTQNVHCYGYGRETTPKMDALAAKGTLYGRAYATAPWTLPSHASLFTGQYPMEHGARSFKMEDEDSETSSTWVYHNPLDLEARTLAEALKEEGYRTVGITANTGFLCPESHLDQGFDAYFNGSYPAETLNLNVWKWFENHPERPFFMFLNYMDAHQPYNTEPIAGFLDDLKEQDSSAVLESIRGKILSREKPPPDDQIQILMDQYDLGIRHADNAIGAVVGKLRELGIYDNTTIIVTSDHGEYFGEHDLIAHSVELYEEALKIPLIVKFAGQQNPRKDNAVISLVDIPMLIFSELGKEAEERNRKSFPVKTGSHPVLAEVNYTLNSVFKDTPWAARFDRDRICLIDWPYKFIQSSDGDDELYELEKDPGEQRDLSEVDAERLGRMKGDLKIYVESLKIHPRPAAPQNGESERQAEALRALGYMK
ncbi:sulfatase [Candidatus Sumerlaeota bacterium]|nr:sulfatase [Candidatus Sumerlaeota bacterium]